ncbi:MAG: hypothetical protein ACOYYS_22805 [Chloroflexota bacterium]
MPRQALFAGLVVDEYDRPVETAYVGEEPCYVVNDAGFRHHIPAADIDRQVLENMTGQIRGSEGMVAEQAAKMLGQDDIFSRAMLENQLKNIDQQLDQVLNSGLPEEGRAYLGMLGFRIRINYHGEIIAIEQPGATDPGEE